MATSSVLGLGDLGLVWSNVDGAADVQIIDLDLASDRGILTAAILSLFLDRRANDDDVPPSGNSQDRRGWWADEFLEIEGDKYGSRLWLLDRAKLSTETPLRAEQYVREALAWMIEDKVCSSVDVTVEPLGKNGLAIGGVLNRPGRDPVAFKFAHTWDHLQEDL